jgi:hypothetical protein
MTIYLPRSFFTPFSVVNSRKHIRNKRPHPSHSRAETGDLNRDQYNKEYYLIIAFGITVKSVIGHLKNRSTTASDEYAASAQGTDINWFHAGKEFSNGIAENLSPLATGTICHTYTVGVKR